MTVPGPGKVLPLTVHKAIGLSPERVEPRGCVFASCKFLPVDGLLDNVLDCCLPMARRTYKQAYETARQELLQLVQKRDQLDQKIRKLRQSIKPLGELCGADPAEVDQLLLEQGFATDSSMGFT